MWILKACTLGCPFCGEIVAIDYVEYEEVESKDEVDEKILKSDEYMVVDDRFDFDAMPEQSDCEHVATSLVWGFDAEVEVSDTFQNELTTLYNHLADDDQLVEDEDAEALKIGEIASEVIEMLELERKAGDEPEKLGDFRYAYNRMYVDKGMGPKGGGPTYHYVFVE
jgi:hypothetical protein